MGKVKFERIAALKDPVHFILLSALWIVGVPAAAASFYVLAMTLLSAKLPPLPPS